MIYWTNIMNELFTDKYLPKNIKSYTGFNHKSVLNYVENTIKGRETKKAIILHGLPGTGKTTLALMLPEHFGIASTYTNSSDQRKKSQINVDTFRSTSLLAEKSLIIFDECDGLSKGAFTELEKKIKKYKMPVILIANNLEKIPYSIRKISHVEKFTVDRFSMLALANKVIRAEKLDIKKADINKIVDASRSYRGVLHALQFGVCTTYTETLSTDTCVLNSLTGQSVELSGDMNDLIVRFNDNSTQPGLISLADMWNRRYMGGYTFGKYIVQAILGSIRNPKIKKITYPRTYAMIHHAKTGKQRVVKPDGEKSRAPKIKILGFK